MTHHVGVRTDSSVLSSVVAAREASLRNSALVLSEQDRTSRCALQRRPWDNLIIPSPSAPIQVGSRRRWSDSTTSSHCTEVRGYWYPRIAAASRTTAAGSCTGTRSVPRTLGPLGGSPPPLPPPDETPHPGDLDSVRSTRSRRGANEANERQNEKTAKSRTVEKDKSRQKRRLAVRPYWWAASRTLYDGVDGKGIAAHHACVRTYFRTYPHIVPVPDGAGAGLRWTGAKSQLLLAPEAVLVRCRSVEDAQPSEEKG